MGRLFFVVRAPRRVVWSGADLEEAQEVALGCAPAVILQGNPPPEVGWAHAGLIGGAEFVQLIEADPAGGVAELIDPDCAEERRACG